MSHTFLHSHLRQTFTWYDSWHNHPGHPYIHWLSFLVLSLSIFSYAHHLTSDLNYEDNNFLKINTAQAQGADAFNLSQVTIVNSAYDPRGWQITTGLNNVLLNNQTVPVTSTNVFDQWYGAGNENPPITHTLWIFFSINGQWYGSGMLGYYCAAPDTNGNGILGEAADGCDASVPAYSVVHGSIVDGNCGWYYNSSWAPMHNYPVRAGDPIGFMVTAGMTRVAGTTNIQQRSNVITIPSPYDLGTSCPGETPPTPTPIPRNIYFLTPYALQAGQVMTISGQNLTPNVNFYNAANTLTQTTGTMNTDATEVVVIVPATLVPGLYTVSVGPDPESNRAQLEVLLGTYTPGPSGPQVPIISSINPTVASPGDVIEIMGEYLTPVVQFIGVGGATTVATGTVSNDYRTTTVTIPSGIAPGIYNIGIVGEFGTAVSADVLTIISTDTPISAASIPQPTAQATSFQDLISGAFNYSLIVVGIAVFIMIMWGGFLWLTSAANPGNIATAKRYIFNAILGAVLLISAYVILYTINPELVGGSLTLPGIEAPPPGTGGGGGGFSTQSAAQALLARIGSGAFSTNATCGGNYHARQNIQDMAAGGAPAVCTATTCTPCTPGGVNGNIYVWPDILNGLVQFADRGIAFTVTSFTTGNHAAGSSHYLGRAVDISINGGNMVWIEARAALDSYGGNAICEDVADPDNDQSAGNIDDPDCSSSALTHIHWQI